MKFAVETIDERYAALTREQVARALGICVDTLDAMHSRGEGPPRFRASPRRWAYPAQDFRRWQEQRANAA
jgi:predicted DNA-binding transcriptional regulator AlpA